MRSRRAPSSNRNGERGFALLLVFLLAAAVALLLYQQLPRVAFESERDKEQILIDRGEQYKRAIQLFYAAYARYPTTLEELEKTNDKRYLRRRYVDPYTGKSEWRLIHVNGGGQLTDSLVTKPPGSPTDPNNPNKDQTATNGGTNPAGGSPVGNLASNLSAGGNAQGGFPAIGLPPISTVPGANGIPGDPNNPANVNAAVLRRPSDRVLAPGQFPTGPTPGLPPGQPTGVPIDPNNPNQANYPNNGTGVNQGVNPSFNPNDPNNLAQQQAGQFPAGQAPFQANPQANNPTPFNSQVPFNNSLNPTDFPPISLQAMQQGNGAAAQVQAQFPGQVPGQAFPGQAFPGQTVAGGQNGGGNQVRLGQNGQFIPVNPGVTGQSLPGQGVPGQSITPISQPFPGSTPFPGTQQGQGAQPFPTGTSGQVFDSSASNSNANPGIPGQQGAPGGNGAINLINQLLTTPRQPPPGIASGIGGTATSGGLGIAGVASTFDAPSVKVYMERKKFKEWEFIYKFQTLTVPTAPTATGTGTGTGGTNTTTGGASGTGTQTSSPFGTSSPTTPFPTGP